MRRRKEISGERRSAAICRLLLRNGFALDFWQRLDLHRWLDRYPALRELYTRQGSPSPLLPHAQHRPRPARLRNLAAQWAALPIPEIQTLRRALLRWKHEVVAYFDTGITKRPNRRVQPQGKARRTQSFRVSVLPKLSSATLKRVRSLIFLRAPTTI